MEMSYKRIVFLTIAMLVIVAGSTNLCAQQIVSLDSPKHPATCEENIYYIATALLASNFKSDDLYVIVVARLVMEKGQENLMSLD